MATAFRSRAVSRSRGCRRRQFTLNDVCSMLDRIDAAQRVRPRSARVTLSHDMYAAMMQGYTLLWRALARAGLHVDRIPTNTAAWVWVFCWNGGPWQGPFRTLDAALDAALAQIRSNGGTDVPTEG